MKMKMYRLAYSDGSEGAANRTIDENMKATILVCRCDVMVYPNFPKLEGFYRWKFNRNLHHLDEI